MLPGLLTLAWLALAPPPGVELRWSAPDGCPTQTDFEQQVAALAVTRPANAGPQRVVFRVERRGDRWHLLGELSGASNGLRELDAATCHELAEAAALIAAIAIDPTADTSAAVVPPPIVPPTAPPDPTATNPALVDPTATTPALVDPTATTPTLVDPTATTPALVDPTIDAATADAPPLPSPAARRPSALLGLAAGLGLGALSAPAGVLRLALGLRGDRWSLALAQDLWLPRDIPAAQDPSLGGRFWLWSAGLRGCAIVRAGPLELPLCAALSAGVMSARGIGDLDVARRQRSPWLAAAVGPGLRVPLHRRIGLLVMAELLAALARPRFEISTLGTVCCDRTVGGQFTAGVELRLP